MKKILLCLSLLCAGMMTFGQNAELFENKVLGTDYWIDDEKQLLYLILDEPGTVGVAARPALDNNGIVTNTENGSIVHNVTKTSIKIEGTVSHNGNTYSVTEILEYGFEECESLTSITLPATITAVGEDAFSDCSNLQDIILSSGFVLDDNNPWPEDWNVGLGTAALSIYMLGNIDSSITLSTIFGKSTPVNFYYFRLIGNCGVTQYPDVDLYAIFADNLEDAATSQTFNDNESGVVFYYRDFSHNYWQPLFVPISSVVSEWGEEIEIAELTSVTSNGTTDVMHWNKLTAEQTVASNTPYIIRYKGNIPEGTSVHYEQAFRTNVEWESNGDDHLHNVNMPNSNNTRIYNLIGKFVEVDGPSLVAANAYGMGNGNFYKATANNALHAQRFYLTITDNQGQTCPPPTGMQVMVDDEIIGTVEDLAEPEATIDNNYYDVLGRRIDKPQQGYLYIHQGKKIIYSEE